MRWFPLSVFGAATTWVASHGGADPRYWPDVARWEAERVRAAAAEALEAGRQAAQRREAELDARWARFGLDRFEV